MLAGCNLIYRPDAPQGSRISQKQVARLKKGMSQKEVIEVMGNPTLQPMFEPTRWDYVYLRQPGEGKAKQATVILWFEKDKLAKFVVQEPDNLDP